MELLHTKMVDIAKSFICVPIGPEYLSPIIKNIRDSN